MKFKKALKWVGGIILSVILERLFSLIPIKDLFTSEKWNWLVQTRFNIIDLVLFVVLLIVVFICITAFESNKSDRKKTRIKKQLQKMNSFTDDNAGIKVTWDISIGTVYDNDPHPKNIRLFCTKHEIPLLMQHGRCTDLSCPNSLTQYDEHVIKNSIESMLLNEQEKLIKK